MQLPYGRAIFEEFDEDQIRKEDTLSEYGHYGWEDKVNRYRVKLDGVTYETYEDPNDGYRSRMEEWFISKDQLTGLFYEEVTVEFSEEDLNEDDYFWRQKCALDIIRSVKTGKPILYIGTLNCDDYYPMAYYQYLPQNLSDNAK